MTYWLSVEGISIISDMVHSLLALSSSSWGIFASLSLKHSSPTWISTISLNGFPSYQLDCCRTELLGWAYSQAITRRQIFDLIGFLMRGWDQIQSLSEWSPFWTGRREDKSVLALAHSCLLHSTLGERDPSYNEVEMQADPLLDILVPT